MSGAMKKIAEEMRKKYISSKANEAESFFSADEKDAISRYKQALERKENFEVIFDSSETDGTLIGRDQYGVRIVLDGEQLKKDLPYYDAANKASFIGVYFNVKVTSVDEANGVVYVRSGYAGSTAHSTKQTVIREILGELGREKQGSEDYLVLPGRVTGVNQKHALIDILGLGILGIIPASEWVNGYTRHLPKVVKKGEVYDFVVLKQKAKSKQYRSLAFELTRRPITNDPWEAFKEKNSGLGVDSVISIKCIDKPAGKSYWWGISPMVEGIEIMCDYSTSIARPFVNCTYKCRIKRLDPDSHKLQAVPFELIDTPSGTKEAVKFISERPKARKNKSNTVLGER